LFLEEGRANDGSTGSPQVGTEVYQKKMFYNFSLSERVSEDHFLLKKGSVKQVSQRINVLVASLVARSRLWRDRQDALDFAFLPEADLPMAEAHLKTPRAKATIKQRKTYAETIFAEAKNSHGLRRAICRGLDKVTIQDLLTCAVQNI